MKIVVLIVVAILVLSFFGFNIQSIAESPTSQSNFAYVKSLVVSLWNNYLKAPVLFVYREIWLKYVWVEIKKLFTSFRAGQTADWYINNSPSTNFNTSTSDSNVAG